MLLVGVFFVLIFKNSIGFDLDDVEYDKMPPLFTLDNYDRCLLYNGTYCVVKLDLFADPCNKLMKQIKDYTKSTTIKHYNYTYLEKGICVTDTCSKFIGNKNLNSNKDLRDIIERCSNESIYRGYGLEAKVADVYYCDKKRNAVEPEASDWLVLAVFGFIVLFNAGATFYDYMLTEEDKKKLSKGKRLLLCFSIFRNFKYLVSPGTEDPKYKSLKGISALRTIASFPMTLGHIQWVLTYSFLDNTHDLEKAYSIPHFQMIFNGMIIVQIFFVISGFLLVYNLRIAGELRKLTLKMIPMIIIHRYWRLTPPMAVMLAFTSTWLRFLGSGPLWNYFVTPVVNDCRKYWWQHVLYINNYMATTHCAIQTWHTAADTQLFIMGIIVCLIIRSRRRNVILGSLLVLGCVLPALNIYYYDLNPVMIFSPEFVRTMYSRDFELAYRYGHNNIACFVVGMFTAYELYDAELNGTEYKGKIYKILLRIVVPVINICFFAGSMFYEEDMRSPLWIRLLYQGTHRLIFGILVAYMIFASARRVEEIIPNILEWKGFVVTGRLTYSVFLLHMNFVPIIAGMRTQLQHLSYLNLIIYQLGITALTYIIAVPFFLMVEAPMNPVLKLLMTPAKRDDPSLGVPEPGKPFISDVIRSRKKKAEEQKTMLQKAEEEKKKLLEDSVRENDDRKMKHL